MALMNQTVKTSRFISMLDQLSRLYPNDEYSRNLLVNIDNSLVRSTIAQFEKSISEIDPESWAVLRSKAIRHYLDHRKGQEKQGFYFQLNDCFAYKYLHVQGAQNIRILRESSSSTPDLEFLWNGTMMNCKVKSIGISDHEIERFSSESVFSSSVYQELSTGFMRKLQDDIMASSTQLKFKGRSGLVFLLVTFDDFSMYYYRYYRKQILSYLRSNCTERVYLKFCLFGNRRIDLTGLKRNITNA